MTSIILFFVGVKVFVSIINFVYDIKKSDTLKEIDDNIPPRIPDVYNLPDFTNQDDIQIKGNAEISSTVFLYLNNKKYSVVTGNDGVFLFNEKLLDGDNQLYLNSEDSSGNLSLDTKTYHINLDKSAPELEITDPSNNSTFYGSSEKIVEIKGKTESDSTLSINERFVNVMSDGSFFYQVARSSRQ